MRLKSRVYLYTRVYGSGTVAKMAYPHNPKWLFFIGHSSRQLSRYALIHPASLLRSAAITTIEPALCQRNVFKVDIEQKLSVEWRRDGRLDVATTTAIQGHDQSNNGKHRSLNACHLRSTLSGW